MEWALVYDLATDERRVDAMQQATLRGEGLSREPSLVGSPEWWKALEEGALPPIVVEGTIHRVYWASSGPWPEFELNAQDGSRVAFTRHGDVGRSVDGLLVRVTYARHPWAEGTTSVGGHHDLIVRVEIEESPRRLDLGAPRGRSAPGLW